MANTPHVHAEMIKRWAEGAQIQYYRKTYIRGWTDIDQPTWLPDYEYRVKPEIELIEYRNFLWKDACGTLHVYVSSRAFNDRYPREDNPNFVRWIGDWQQVEVEHA